MQGGEGDSFYVVGSGEYEVLAIQVYISIQIYYKYKLVFRVWVFVKVELNLS